MAHEDQPEPASHKQQLCVAHDLAATFALLELILKLKTSNLQTVPSQGDICHLFVTHTAAHHRTIAHHALDSAVRLVRLAVPSGVGVSRVSMVSRVSECRGF